MPYFKIDNDIFSLRGKEGRMLAEHQHHRTGTRHEPEHRDRQNRFVSAEAAH